MHVLAQLARCVGDDWEARWGYRPLLLETFVDPARFRGSCYRAAGWALLGRTSGEGPKVDPDSDEEQSHQYCVYVLEASLYFRNGMVIPLMSEFLEYEAGDGEQRKQDCETKAFHGLAARIKPAFPRLPALCCCSTDSIPRGRSS